MINKKPIQEFIDIFFESHNDFLFLLARLTFLRKFSNLKIIDKQTQIAQDRVLNKMI